MALGSFGQAGLSVLESSLWQYLTGLFAGQWGIYYEGGSPLVGSDTPGFTGILLSALGFKQPVTSTQDFEYRKEMHSSEFPVERGGFASYNKVELPGRPMVVMAISGSESDRSQFLNAIDFATKSTRLYSVVTPTVTYYNHSLDRYAYRRSGERGATLLTVDIFLTEIRQVSSQYTQINAPKNPSATPPQNSGNVQATPVK